MTKLHEPDLEIVRMDAIFPEAAHPDSCPCLAHQLEAERASHALTHQALDVATGLLDLRTKERDRLQAALSAAGDAYLRGAAAEHKACADAMEAAYFRGTEAGLDAAGLEQHQAELARALHLIEVRTSERNEALESLEVANQIGDTFWAALKPLNLPAIYVENPGQHVTDLIRERDQAQADKEALL